MLQGTIRAAHAAIGVAVLTLSASVAVAQDVEIAAAIAPPAMERCLLGTEPPRRVVEACSAAIATRQLIGREGVLVRLARAAAYSNLHDAENANADRHAAIDLIDRHIDSARPDADTLFLRAATWHALGDADRALPDYDAAIRAYPFSPLLFIDRGILLTAYKHSYMLAIMDFSRALELVPDDPAALYGRSLAYRASGDTERADADQRAALARDPSIAQRFAASN